MSTISSERESQKGLFEATVEFRKPVDQLEEVLKECGFNPGYAQLSIGRNGEYSYIGSVAHLGPMTVEGRWAYFAVKFPESPEGLPYDLAERISRRKWTGDTTHYSGVDKTLRSVLRIAGYAGGNRTSYGACYYFRRDDPEFPGKACWNATKKEQKSWSKLVWDSASAQGVAVRTATEIRSLVAEGRLVRVVSSYHVDTKEALVVFVNILRKEGYLPPYFFKD